MTMQKKRTKIVCTIGPSTWDHDVLVKMIDAGMNVARINAAFSDVAQLERVAKTIREISTDVALMLDIKGSDVRLNDFGEELKLEKDMEIIIGNTTEDKIYPKNYLELHNDLDVGNIIFFDDGKVKAEVVAINDGKMHCKVIEGKVLKTGKSLNTPGVHLSISAVTPIDMEQMDFCMKDNWDFVAASYIRDAKDAQEVRDYLKGTDIQIIAKIEENMGVENIDEILKIVDGVMIGRGDMGVEMPYEKLPVIQKILIQKCNAAAKPVITATEVLDSMTHSSSPTRAEISDVANAIWDGTDAIMTSGETSTGEFPIETIAAISRIAVENENFLLPEILEPFQLEEHQVLTAISNAAFEMVESIDIDKILVVSQKGITPRVIARLNLPVPIIAFVSDGLYKRQLAMTKGVEAHVFPDKSYSDRDFAIKAIIEHSLKENLINHTDKILLVGKASKFESTFPNVFEYVEMAEYKG